MMGFVVNAVNTVVRKAGKTMNDDDVFVGMLNKMKEYSLEIKGGTMTLSDYYFKMADFFNSIEPHKGEHMGNWFNFKNDAQEFIQLAKKELGNEEQ